MYCLYRHIRLDTNEIFYIGIGNKLRPYSTKSRSKYWKSIVAKAGYKVEIIEENLTKIEAVEKEINLITSIGRKDLGRGTLCNLTSGGDGCVELNTEIRGIISSKLKGMKRPQRSKEYCENISKAKLGNKNPMFGKTSSRAKVIIKYNLNNDVLDIFANSYLAAESVNGTASSIIRCCKGKRKSYKQFKWKYKLL